MSLDLDLIFTNATRTAVDTAVLHSAAQKFLASLGLTGSMQLDLSILSEQRIKRLNNEHRGINKSTDVLSFPLLSSQEAIADVGSTAYGLRLTAPLGSIVICPAIVAHHTKRGDYGSLDLMDLHSGATGEKYAMIYVLLHGLMHLLGHDHVTDDQNAQFEQPIHDYLKNAKEGLW